MKFLEINVVHPNAVVYLIVLLCLGCNVNQKSNKSITYFNDTTSVILEEFIIGLEHMGEDYQLGDPISVRTDNKNTIFIADRASLTIKAFNSDGEYINDIGRRGRGPSEFLDINSFDIFPEENFFILDRGNFRYTYISKLGDFVYSQPIDFSMEWQFYPDDIDFYEDKIIALFTNGVSHTITPRDEKKFFYIYDDSLKTKLDSFFSFDDFINLELSDFAWVEFIGKPGSFTLNAEKNELFYSPLIYHNHLYHFKKENEHWKFNKVVRTKLEIAESYQLLQAVEFEKQKRLGASGLKNMLFSGIKEPLIGRINAFDAGIHTLNDGRIISFIGKWRNFLTDDGGYENLVDIYAQIIDEKFEVQYLGFIKSIEATRMPFKPFINWKDKDDNFYLLDNTDINYPTVTKFSIDKY